MEMDITKLTMDEVEVLVEKLGKFNITTAIKRVGDRLVLEVNNKAAPLCSVGLNG